MVKLLEKGTDALIGQITEDQLKFLVDNLEEESMEDKDYFINSDTIEYFEEINADSGLIRMLRQALGAREEMEIYWTTT